MQLKSEELLALAVEHTVKVAIITAVNSDEKVYDDISMDTDIMSLLNLDSLDAAEVIMQIEEVHGMDEIPEDYARKSVTFKDMYSYTKEHCVKSLDELLSYIFQNPDGDFKKDKFIAHLSGKFDIPADSQHFSSPKDLLALFSA